MTVMSTNVGIEALLSDLGKATRRGTRRCPQCGMFVLLFDKNMIFRNIKIVNRHLQIC
jgi:hypothetical protein